MRFIVNNYLITLPQIQTPKQSATATTSPLASRSNLFQAIDVARVGPFVTKECKLTNQIILVRTSRQNPQFRYDLSTSRCGCLTRHHLLNRDPFEWPTRKTRQRGSGRQNWYQWPQTRRWGLPISDPTPRNGEPPR